MIRKFFTSAALALLLMVSLLPRAHAETYVSLGKCSAGEPVSLFICQADPNVQVLGNGLPAGTHLQEYNSGAGRFINLEGVPMAAGSFSFTVEAGERYYCSIDITAAAPWVNITGDLRCRPGERVVLECEAGSPDGGVLSYQWYSGMGVVAVPIDGATDSRYEPDTSRAGVESYACLVTNTNGPLNNVTMSEPMTLTVSQPQISSISVESMPLKTSYLVGDRFESAGLTLRVRYDDGSGVIVSQGFTAEPAVFTEAGTQTVHVRYEGKSCSFNVMVNRKEESVTGIGVLTLPRKVSYTVGESLETAGLSIRAYTSDGGHFDVSSGLDCSPTVFRTAGSQIVTVTYKGKTCTFGVKVEDDTRITGITVLTLPANREYTVGDAINTAGLTIQVNTNKGSETVKSGFTCSPRIATTPGTQEITVIYGQFTASFNVNVKAKAAPTPTPKPTPTPVPSAAPTTLPTAQPTDLPTASLTPSPVHTAAPTRQNTGLNAAVLVFFVIAVLALAGLAAYVWYLRKTGFADEGEYEASRIKPGEAITGLIEKLKSRGDSNKKQ